MKSESEILRELLQDARKTIEDQKKIIHDLIELIKETKTKIEVYRMALDDEIKKDTELIHHSQC